MYRGASRSLRLATTAFLLLALASALPPAPAGAAPNSCTTFQPGANLSKCDLRGRDLSGLDLSGADLSKARLEGANLSGTNLSGANLDKAELDGANLTGANLSNANLSKADLRNAVLIGANLSGANLDKAILHGVVGTGANLSSANLAKAELNGADLSEALLVGADLTKASAIDASFVHADFTGADITEVNFSGANLRAANMSNTTGGGSATFNNATCPDGSTAVSGACVPSSTSSLDVRVVHADGPALHDVLVELREVGDPNGNGTPDELLGSDCSSEGEAEFPNIPNGTYALAIIPGPGCSGPRPFVGSTTFTYNQDADWADGFGNDSISGTDPAMWIGELDVLLTTDPPPTARGVLDVRVVDGLGGPLSGVNILLREVGDPNGNGIPDELIAVGCSHLGEAEFINIPEGTYQISTGSGSARCPMNPIDAASTTVTYSPAADLADGFSDDDVSGPGGPYTRRADALLMPPAILDVRVTFRGAGPLSDILVELREVGDPNGNGTSNELIASACSVEGEAELVLVSNGTYEITASNAGGPCGPVPLLVMKKTVTTTYSRLDDWLASGLNDNISGPGPGLLDTPDANLALEQGGMLDIAVVDAETHEPVSGVRVLLLDDVLDEVVDSACADDGEVQFVVPRVVLAGTYRFSVESDDGTDGCEAVAAYNGIFPVSYWIEADVSQDGVLDDDVSGLVNVVGTADLVLFLYETGTLDVRVVDGLGGPLSLVPVLLHEVGDPNGNGIPDELIAVECSISGEAEFINIPEGTYQISTGSGSARCPMDPIDAASTTVTYSPAADLADGFSDDDVSGPGGPYTRRADALLMPPAILDVRVTFRGAGPLSDILVELREVGDPNGNGTSNELIASACSVEGEAELVLVSNGTYEITAASFGVDCTPPSSNLYVQQVVTTTYNRLDDWLASGLNDSISGPSIAGTPDAELVITPGAMIDIGVVDAETHEPVSGVRVLLLDVTLGQVVDSACADDGEVQFLVPIAATGGPYSVLVDSSDGTDGCESLVEYDSILLPVGYALLADLLRDGVLDDDVSGLVNVVGTADLVLFLNRIGMLD